MFPLNLYLSLVQLRFHIYDVSDHNKSFLTGSVNGVNPVYGSFTPPCKQNLHHTVFYLCFMLFGNHIFIH